MMRITDLAMAKKMERALRQGGNLYTLDDIENALATGAMQSHTANGTWVITAVGKFPNTKSVDILYVVGDLEGAFIVDKQLEDWAREIGATFMTAIGREGWEKRLGRGWKKSAIQYTKDISHG